MVATPNAETAVFLTAITILISIQTLIGACEWLASHVDLKDDGTFSWTLLKTRQRIWSRPWMVRLASPVLGYPGIVFVFVVQALAAACLAAFPNQDVIRPMMLTILMGCTLAVNIRCFPYGVKGADRMRLMVLGALWLREWDPGSRMATEACLWFIALQCCLSYVSPGVSKLLSADWRSGTTLRTIFGNRNMGFKEGREFLGRHPEAARPMSWSVILLQASFPLALLDLRLCFVYLTAMLAFHIANAALMGLNTFVWSWASTYPAVLYVAAFR